MIRETEGAFVTVNHHEIYYVDKGSGPPLVLVHGWGLDLTCWSPIVDRLAARFRVIAMDLRGHGRSQSSSSPFTMRDLSSDLRGLIEHLDLDVAPVVIGHSLGGMIVQQFVADQPGEAAATIVIDSDLNGPAIIRLGMTAGARISSWAMRLAALLLGEAGSLRLYPFLLTPVSYSRSWRREHRHLIAEADIKFRNNDVNGLILSLLAYASRPDLTEQLQAVSIPALLIRGSKDIIMTQGKMESLSRALPTSRLVLVAGSGHMTVIEQPDTVATLVDSFLADWVTAPVLSPSKPRRVAAL